MINVFIYAVIVWCANKLCFLHDRPRILPWMKSKSNELDIIIHVIASQLSCHCDVISNWLWRHQQNEKPGQWNTKTMCKDKIVVFIAIYGFVISCKKWNSVCTLVTNCFCANSSVILLRNLGNKHQIHSLVSTETICHSSTYVILYMLNCLGCRDCSQSGAQQCYQSNNCN